MSTSWDSVVRFEAKDGQVYFAPVPLSDTVDVSSKVTGFKNIEDIKSGALGSEVTIKKLLAPVPTAGNPIVCIGLNYRNHAQEAKLDVPSHPAMWYKPAAAFANPGEEIHVAKQAYDNFLDFEGELTIVTSKMAKDVSVAEAPDYILGYTIGNDLTARLFQHPTKNAGQFTYAKAFDKFAPLGPRLVSTKVFAEQVKNIETKINGKTFQNSPIDLIFDPAAIVSFLSQGTTLPAGTAIMTGTPGGVGWFSKPQYSLQNGDVVEIEVQPIGILSNKISYI